MTYDNVVEEIRNLSLEKKQQLKCLIENLIKTDSKKFTLEELLNGVRPNNIHDEVDTVSPIGREIW